MSKKKCPSCAMEIDSSETECPICGYEFPKTSFAFKAAAIVLVVILILVFLFF